MKNRLIQLLMVLIAFPAVAQQKVVPDTDSATVELPAEPVGQIILPILLIVFLAFMLVSLIKYFLEFRLKSKLINRGMGEQLSAYVSNRDGKEKQQEVMKWAILCFGIGTGLTITYLTAPIHLHSLAIMAFSLGLSYLAYFFYLRK